MTPDEFVTYLFEEVVERGAVEYEQLLSSEPASVRDERWRTINSEYHRMGAEQQAAAKLLARQAAVDAVSTVLGILDGSTLLANHREAFRLLYGQAKETLNGDLQDLFLELDQAYDDQVK